MKKISFFLIFIIIFLNFSHAQTILFLGDSLTEGYQLSKEEAYPYLVEQKLKKKFPKIKVINGGVSGSTSASGEKRLDWYIKANPTHLVLALGANDGLRGFKIEESKKNLSLIIEKAQKNGMRVILAGMQMPRNYGEDYRKKFQQMFLEISKDYKVKLVPFLLEGVGGKTELNLPDGIHPNPRGHEVMAENILKILGPEL